MSDAHRRIVAGFLNPPVAVAGDLLQGLPIIGHGRPIPQACAVFGEHHHPRLVHVLVRGKQAVGGSVFGFVNGQTHDDNIRGRFSKMLPLSSGGTQQVREVGAMRLSALLDPLKRLAHRVFLAYAHYRWRRWRCPWRFYKGRWYVVVRDRDMHKEKVKVITWCCPETGDIESICLPVPGHDYSDYVPFEDRMPDSVYFPLMLGTSPPRDEPDDVPPRTDVWFAFECEKSED